LGGGAKKRGGRGKKTAPRQVGERIIKRRKNSEKRDGRGRVGGLQTAKRGGRIRKNPDVPSNKVLKEQTCSRRQAPPKVGNTGREKRKMTVNPEKTGKTPHVMPWGGKCRGSKSGRENLTNGKEPRSKKDSHSSNGKKPRQRGYDEKKGERERK